MQEIRIEDIIELQTNCKVKGGKLITTLKLDARMPAEALSRLLNLQEKKTPLIVTIGTPQLPLEVTITKYQNIDRETGEIIDHDQTPGEQG